MRSMHNPYFIASFPGGDLHTISKAIKIVSQFIHRITHEGFITFSHNLLHNSPFAHEHIKIPVLLVIA